MDLRTFREFADSEVEAACACHDSSAEFAVRGKEFVGQFKGEISVRLGRAQISTSRLTTIPLHVTGYTTTSDIKGMGRTTLDFDFSRPIAASSVEAGHEKDFFPGVQIMRLHILVTTEAFKGKTLRSMSASALRNEKAEDFPPPEGSVYRLTEPVELEDIAEPGIALATLKKVNTSIDSTTLRPDSITTNSGFRLYSRDGRTFQPSDDSDGEVSFETTLPGAVALTLFDETQRSLGVAFYREGATGRQTIRIPASAWQGRASYYQISVGGLPRTSILPVR